MNTRDDAQRPTGRDLTICQRLVLGASYAATAEAEGVGISTVLRAANRHRAWLNQERALAAEQTAARLVAQTQIAARRLLELVQSHNEHVALGAVRVTLDFSLRWQEFTTLEARLTALEEATGVVVEAPRQWRQSA